MQIAMLALDRLRPHPANANVMSDDLLHKLIAHIERTGRYPPVIVRPAPDEEGCYQLLDGHHRVEALRRLEHHEVRCVVWQVDDAEALVLLTTLNQLRGQDDPKKRAALVTDLARLAPLEQLAGQLPEDRAALERLLELHAPPPPRPPAPLESMPAPVHFFLLPAQRRRLESRLRQLGGKREEALMRLVEQGAHDATS